MIAHVVLFRPRADLSATDSSLFIEAFDRALRAAPSIQRAHVGRRVTFGRAYEKMMSVDFPYAAILEFDDLAGLQAYLDHPAHEEVGRRLFAVAEETLVYDFEMESGAEGLRDLRAQTDGERRETERHS